MREKRPKLPKISSLREKAWKYLSLYIRLKNADLDGNVVCITCGARKHYKEINSGHFFHGHSKPTFLTEINVHPQCVKCNMFMSGNLIEYYRYMLEKYGQETIDELRTLSKQVIKFDRQYYEDHIKVYRDLSDKEMGRLNIG